MNTKEMEKVREEYIQYLERFKEKFMQYLYDNYLPMPEEISWSEEFAVSHDYDEDTGRPCDFLLSLSVHPIDHIVDEAMRKAFKILGLNETYSDVAERDWIFGLLHELGHIATLPNLSEGELAASRVLINVLEFGKISEKNATAQDYYNVCLAYWNTPVEFAANEWVVNMLNIFPNIVYDIEALMNECFEEE